MMGSYKEDTDAAATTQHKRFRRMLKTWTSCLCSFSISIVGGLILTCWELRYHHTNSQLWMVPFGLILFVTPAIVWLSIFISEVFRFKEDYDDDHDVELHPSPAAAGIHHDSSTTLNLDPERWWWWILLIRGFCRLSIHRYIMLIWFVGDFHLQKNNN